MKKITFLFATIVIYICSVGTSAAQDCQNYSSLDMTLEERVSETDCGLQQTGALQMFKIEQGRVNQLPSEDFSVGDEVALCVYLPQTMYVSIWDQPPSGKRERMFPNHLSHPKGDKAVLIQKQSRFCTGLPNDKYAIRVDAQDGRGFGKFYILGTEAYSAMPDETSFEIKEYQTIGMQIVNREKESELGPDHQFPEKDSQSSSFFEDFAMYKVNNGVKSLEVEYDTTEGNKQQSFHSQKEGLQFQDRKTEFQCTEPFTQQKKTRVVGGLSANPLDFPWQVGIRSSQGFCGGSLIGKKWILSAAHCFNEITAQDGSVLPGFSASVSLANDTGAALGQSRKVKKIRLHPKYINSEELGYPNDVAVLELEAGLDTEIDKLMLLADRSVDNLFRQDNSCSTVVGWGLLDENSETISSVLKQVSLPVVDQSSCEISYPNNNISDAQLCAGYRQGGKDSCSGDSGGPLVIRGGPTGWIQVGVVSWGEGCARPNKYGVYTKVSKYYEWIHSIMKNGK